MTCVAAAISRGRVFMAADSAVMSDDRIEILARPKLRRRSGMLVGASGDMAAVGAILDGILLPCYLGGPVAEWLTTVLWPTLNGCLRDLSVRRTEFTVLLGLAHGGFRALASVDQHGSPIVYDRSYAAIGSGEAYALGSMCSGWRRVDPRERVRRAVAAAAEHCCNVGGRVGVLSA
jgi:ATP-dependent protease HslVU (ClpYQ) peptidase subunit